MAEDNYSPKVERALSNYFDGLDKPVSIFIGMWDGVGSKDASRDGDNALIIKTVEKFRENGIDAVPFFDEEAKDPGKVVVTSTGLQTPFVRPEEAKETAARIMTVMENNGIESMGFATPNIESQLLYPARHADVMDAFKVLDIQKGNPDPARFDEIIGKRGKGFVGEMLDQAFNSPDAMHINLAERDEQNILDGCSTLFKGATQGANVFAVISPFEARAVPHASPKLTIAQSYSGFGENASSKGGATYIDKESKQTYGFVYEIEATKDQKYYGNVGLETASPELKKVDTYFETPVLPHRNKVKAVYLLCGNKGNDERYFKVPLNDEKWQEFMELHEPTDNTVKGFLADRRTKQKEQAKQNGTPELYSVRTGQPLETKNYRDLSNLSSLELLVGMYGKGNVSQNEKGEIVCNRDVSLAGLGIEKLPRDFGNVRINGKFDINNNADLKLDGLGQLPIATKGMVNVYPPLNLGDLRESKTEDLIARVAGADKAIKGADGFYGAVELAGIVVDNMPDDFSSAKFEHLWLSQNIQLENLNMAPETKNGIMDLNIKHQDLEIGAEDFLKKIGGNDFDVISGIKFNDGRINRLNLERSNINKFPEGLGMFCPDYISLNPDVVMDNLDNVPYTLNGIEGLNLRGVSEGETTASFLGKIKGRKWAEECLRYEEDGSLKVRNDLVIGKGVGLEAFPKDFGSLKIEGNFEYFKKHLIPSEMQPKANVLQNSKVVDFSAEKGNVYINGKDLENAEELRLPPEIGALKFQEVTKFPKEINIEKASEVVFYEGNLWSVEKLSIKDVNSLLFDGVNGVAADLDFSGVKYVNFSQTDVSKVKTIKVGEKTEALSFSSETFPEIDLDLSKSRDVRFDYCDLRNVKSLSLPLGDEKAYVRLQNVKMPRIGIDLSDVQAKINVVHCDFSEVDNFKLPMPQIKKDEYFGYEIKMPSYEFQGVVLPKMDLDLSAYNLKDLPAEFMTDEKRRNLFSHTSMTFAGANLRNVTSIKLPDMMKELDISHAKFSEVDLDLSRCGKVNLSCADLSKLNSLNLPDKLDADAIVNTQFPAVDIDLSKYSGLNLTGADFSKATNLKLPEGTMIERHDRVALPEVYYIGDKRIENVKKEPVKEELKEAAPVATILNLRGVSGAEKNEKTSNDKIEVIDFTKPVELPPMPEKSAEEVSKDKSLMKRVVDKIMGHRGLKKFRKTKDKVSGDKVLQQSNASILAMAEKAGKGPQSK